jgi:hypothetical protein
VKFPATTTIASAIIKAEEKVPSLRNWDEQKDIMRQAKYNTTSLTWICKKV